MRLSFLLLISVFVLSSAKRLRRPVTRPFEDDIIVYESDITTTYNATLAKTLVKSGQAIRGVRPTATLDNTLRWPQNKAKQVVIPFVFDRLFPKVGPSIQMIHNVLDSIATSGVVSFVNRTNETNYIIFTAAASGCWSYVGFIGEPQEVNLDPAQGCVNVRTATHEILHTLGFWHEQSRVDRDTYLRIIWTNIKRGYENNFAKRAKSNTPITYDYSSIMHYKANVFALDRKLPTLIPIKPLGATIGEFPLMSAKDTLALQLYYMCTSGPRMQIPKTARAWCTDDCRCWKGKGQCKKNSECQPGLRCVRGVCMK